MKQRFLCNLNSILVTIIFSIAIFVPFFLGIVEQDKDVSVNEKRALAKFPDIELSIDGISKFPTLFDAYYTDHFGLRDWLVKYYRFVKFHLGDSPSDDVTLGKDGWLFLGSIRTGYTKYSDPIGDARNVNLFSDRELEQFAMYMTSLSMWLNSRGIEYIFVIAPNKHTIYFEKLPGYVVKANEKSSTDQLVEYLEQYTDVTVVDLREKLIENKNKYPLYFKNDTHWNHFGANIAQYEIMLEIEKLFPTLIKPEYAKMKDGIRRGGDLATLVGMTGFRDVAPQPIFENACTPSKYPANAKNPDPHSYSCDGEVLNALIYRDSFFTALQPYFARKFKHSTYVFNKVTYSSLEEYIDSEDPDVVIEEWVERSLPLVPKLEPGFKSGLYRKQFECSDRPIFANDFKGLTFNGQVKRIETADDSILLESIGKDPVINFPSLPLQNGNQYIVHIELESSVKSRLQLFYSDSEVTGHPFSEPNSVRIAINSGENDIYIALDYEKLGKRLRLDPIAELGEVRIKTIEIREVKDQLILKCAQTQ